MSEHKRANLMTVEVGKKGKHKVSKTIRIALDLFEPNKKKFPEFSYKELVKDEQDHRKEEKEKKGSSGQNGIRDPFSDNDEDVERIAKQFEQKYGSSSTYGRRKGSCKQEDYADIGAGYDENDSFIDNTDGYDEMVPPECDTVLGGFYINSGSLEFKNVVGIGVDLDDASPTHRKASKRPLSSSESEEGSSSSDDSETSTGEKRHSEEERNGKITDSDKSGEDAEKKVKVKDCEDTERVKKKRKSSQDTTPNSQNEQPPSHHASHKKTVKELLAESRAPSGVSESNVDASTDSPSSDSSCKAPAAVPSSDNPVSSDSSRDAPQPSTSPPPPPQAPPIPPLPPNLPPEAAVLAKRLKALADAHFSSHTGKLSGPEINEIILGMEKHCRKAAVAPSVRHAIFSHAAALLRRGKPGLIQRARRLADDSQRMNSSKSTIDNLKTIIEQMKPALLQNYKLESERIVETNKNIALQNSTADDDKKISEKRLPKRRFPWNDQVRHLISDLLSEQNIPEEDEPMSKFLHAVVLPLFPSGFVRMPTLLQQAKLSKNIKLDKPKNAANKSFDKAHASGTSLNKQSIANKTSPDIRINSQGDRNISDMESMISAHQRSNKVLSTLGVGTDGKDLEHRISESMYRNENPNLYINDSDAEKSKTFRLSSDNVALSPKIGDNISISVTNVFQKSNESEKLSPSPPKTDKYHTTTSSSLTITPVPNTHKDTRPYQSQTSSDMNNSLTIIPKPSITRPSDTAPSVSPTNQNNSSALKVKSTSALFDKSTIAKIISGKNTQGDTISRSENRDSYRSRSHVEHRSEKLSTQGHTPSHPNIDLLSKPSTLPASPLPMLSKAYLGTSEPRMEDLKPTYNSSNEMFVKPKYKTDNSSHYHRSSGGSVHTSPGGYHKSPEGNNKYQRDSSKSPHDKTYESINLPPAHTPHSDRSPLTSGHSTSSVLKQHRIPKKYEESSPVPSDSPNSLRHFNFTSSNYKSSKADAVSADGNSSDDCVEVVGDDGYRKPKISMYREEEARKTEGARRELEKHYNNASVTQQTSGHSKSDFSIKSIVDNKPYSVKNILKSPHSDYDKVQSVESHSVIHNQPDKSVLKYPNIKRQAILENEAAECKKYKSSECVDMKAVDRVSKYVDDHNYSSVDSSVKCEPVSVIKDNFTSKSADNRYTDHVYDLKASESKEEADSEKYTLDMELNRVMQDLKELQDLQKCSQEEPHHRMYDDGTNKLYRGNHYVSDGKSSHNIKNQQDTSGTILKSQPSFMETTSSHNISTGSHH